MLKTKLESLLQSCFCELDGLFEKREYGENIRMGASVDDAFSPISVSEVKARSLGEDMAYVASVRAVFSDYQNAVLDDTVPFFRRVGFHEGFKVVYSAYIHPERDSYELVADKLVPNVDLETIDISWKGIRVIDMLLGKTVDVQLHLDRDDIPADIKEKVAFLIGFDSQPYNPELVVEELKSLLKC